MKTSPSSYQFSSPLLESLERRRLLSVSVPTAVSTLISPIEIAPTSIPATQVILTGTSIHAQTNQAFRPSSARSAGSVRCRRVTHFKATSIGAMGPLTPPHSSSVSPTARPPARSPARSLSSVLTRIRASAATTSRSSSLPSRRPGLTRQFRRSARSIPRPTSSPPTAASRSTKPPAPPSSRGSAFSTPATRAPRSARSSTGAMARSRRARSFSCPPPARSRVTPSTALTRTRHRKPSRPHHGLVLLSVAHRQRNGADDPGRADRQRDRRAAAPREGRHLRPGVRSVR
jgi:hypothetical protein